jgi:16S rRNA (cytidine1402-2'-O)-methyltransferase
VTAEVKSTVEKTKHFIVENERNARRFLKHVHPSIDFEQVMLYPIGKHDDTDVNTTLQPLVNGDDMGLMSDAGCPVVADPGSLVVQKAHQIGVKIVPLVGPSSIVLALMASGFNGQNFTFHGYLPVDKTDRKIKLKQIENGIYQKDQTQIFIETPFRNNQLIQTILLHCQSATKLCIAVNLTTNSEFIQTKSVQDWNKQKIDLNKQPAIFLLYK